MIKQHIVSIVLISLLFCLVGVNSWQRAQKELQESQEHAHQEEAVLLSWEELQRQGIKTGKAASQEMTEQVHTLGKLVVEPLRQRAVTPRVEGVIEKIFVEKGDVVQKGDPLAVINSEEVGRQRANFYQAAASLAYYQELLTREEALHDRQVSSTYDYLERKKEFTEAKLEKEAAFFALHRLGIHPSKKEEVSPRFLLRSPIEGTVLEAPQLVGQHIASDAELFHIVDLNAQRVEVLLTPKEAQEVKRGDKIYFTSFEGKTVGEGSVETLFPSLSEKAPLVTALCSYTSKEEQKSYLGSYLLAKIVTKSCQGGVCVAKEAVQSIEGCTCVFVKTETGFEKREVCVGKSDDSYIEITDLLAEGEEVAEENVFVLKAEALKEEGGHHHHHH